MTVEAVLPLRRSTDVPQLARSFVEQHLVHISPTVCQDVVLLVSELVTNVVRHGAEPARLVLTVDADTVRVDVHDSGSDLPRRVRPASPRATESSGRGLLIVDAIANSWGVTTDGTPAGKTVWFDVAI